MAELRYKLVLDGTQTSGDFTDPDPTTDTGNVVVPNLTSVVKVQINLPNGVPVTLATHLDRGGVETFHFFAVTAPAVFSVGKSTAIGLETWQVAAGGWFMCHCAASTDDLLLSNTSGAAIIATAYIGGMVV